MRRRRGAADVEVTALAYDNRARRRRARCSSACRASRATATTSRPTRSRAARSALVVERPLGLGVPEVVVDDVRAAMAPAAAALLRRPDRASCAVVGITGTNGKTTTAFLVRALLEAAGIAVRACSARSTAVVGGVEQRGRAHDARGDRPPARRSREMLDAGDEACAMEVSSHALDAAPRRRDPLRGRRSSPT